MKTAKLFFMGVAVAILSMGCSKDDDGSKGGKTDFSSNVPSGEIVPVELRNETLTGYSELNAPSKGVMPEGIQKWWEYKHGEISSVDCPEFNQPLDVGTDYYFGLYPDGSAYSKYGVDGTPTYIGDWNWTSSAKEALVISWAEGAVFYLTYLNETNLVYASKQSVQGCSVETYEQMHNPHQFE